MEEEKSRKAFVRIAAMGLLLLHIPAWREGGREEEKGAFLSEECLCSGALRTVRCQVEIEVGYAM